MKKVSAVIAAVIFSFVISIKALSQISKLASSSTIEPFHLSIGFYKTSNLVFPYSIKSIDRGSKDVLVQKAKGVENVLQIKAGKANFPETNLTVITADGSLYSYVVNFDNNPSALNFRYEAKGDKVAKDAFFSSATANEATIKVNAKKVAVRKRTLYRCTDRKYAMKLSLNGLFIDDEVMYYQFKIENNSAISYDIDQLRFFIQDQRKSKRTASQELEIKPLLVHSNQSKIEGQSEQVFVFALPKFTIPDKKFLHVQLMEKGGGRHLSLALKNRVIIKARLIP